ncbi:MAG: hypothetical protein GY951_15165, partial [Psychromonas sp.]|nr:hypothetical protein [Psychromonas sp.]
MLLNQYQIKTKVLLMVILPLVTLLYLAYAHINTLNNQLQSLQTLSNKSTFLNQTSGEDITGNGQYELSEKVSLLPFIHESTIESLISLIADTFPLHDPIVIENILLDLQETQTDLLTTNNTEEQADLGLWLIDLHKQLLLNLEQNKLNTGLIAVDGHIVALLQLKWLMLWAEEGDYR